MKVIFSICLSLALVAATLADTWQADFKDENHPGKCVPYGHVLNPGVYRFANRCFQLECKSSGVLYLYDCPSMADVKVYQNGDPEAAYPDCCDQAIELSES